MRRDMNATDTSRLHEKHVVLEGVSARVREHAVSHHNIHVSAKNKTQMLRKISL